MTKETKYKNTFNLKATVHSVIFILVFAGILIYLFYYICNAPITETGFFQSKLSKILSLFTIAIFFFFMISTLLGALFGHIKGTRKIAKEDKLVKKTNPYIYYRELPNEYGIGITSLLFDSTIENYKDIVAIIIDLCARKYLHLIKQGDKYIIKVLKGIDDNLLNNEKYILYLILDNDIKNINYQEWYNYCMQDGIDLGLYYHVETKGKNGTILSETVVKKRMKKHLILSIVFSALVFISFINNGGFLKACVSAIFWFILSYAILIVPFYLLNIGTAAKNMRKQASDENYHNLMNNHLTRTQKGIEELHKLDSFRLFIKDFGHFVDKRAEEVVLWDRYLSYAQVFGLTKEIMKSGYKELIDNSSFQIDSIDNITLNNIELE